MSKAPAVWFVDDDRADHTIFTRAFAQHGIQLKSYFSAEEAFEALASGERPNLVLLDVRMPGLGGFHFLHQRNRAGIVGTPVVMLSSSVNPDDVVEAYASGANAYLQKPPDYSALKRFVKVVTDFWFDMAVLPTESPHQERS